MVVAPHHHAFVAQGAGRIQSRYVSQVGFEVGGRLTAREVDVGAVVKKGQSLARLSAIDYQNKVTAAEADLTAAKAAVAQAAPQEERYRILIANGHTTRPIYENAIKAVQSAEAQVQSAEANLRIARNQLSYTELRAPDDGVVDRDGGRPWPSRFRRPEGGRDLAQFGARGGLRRGERACRTCEGRHAR